MKITEAKETSARDNDGFVYSLSITRWKNWNRKIGRIFYVQLFTIWMFMLCDFIACSHSILPGKQLRKDNRCYLLKMHAVVKSSDQVPSSA